MKWQIGIAAACLSLLMVENVHAQPRAMTSYYLGDITGNEEKDTVTGAARPMEEPVPVMTAGAATYIGLRSGDAEKDTFAFRPQRTAPTPSSLRSEAR